MTRGFLAQKGMLEPPRSEGRSLVSRASREKEEGHLVLYAVLAALVAVAYASLWALGRSPYARYLGHADLGTADGGVVAFALFVAGWTLMSTGMMLPTALPLLRRFSPVVRRRRGSAALQVLLGAAFVGVWAAFGVAAYEGDRVVHAVVERLSWVNARPELVAAGVLAVAGLYQFSALKYRCLVQCRSPDGFIVRHWHGGHAAAATVRIGAHYGVFCIGCCWALMLVVFAVGTANVGLMLLLGAVMALEKNVPGTGGLSAAVGVVLAAGSILLALRAVPVAL